MITGIDLENYKEWDQKKCNIIRETCTSNYLKHECTAEEAKQSVDIARKGRHQTKILFSASRLLLRVVGITTSRL